MTVTPNFIKTLVRTTRKYGPSVNREKNSVYGLLNLSCDLCREPKSRVCNQTFGRVREQMKVEFVTLIATIYVAFDVIFILGK